MKFEWRLIFGLISGSDLPRLMITDSDIDINAEFHHATKRQELQKGIRNRKRYLKHLQLKSFQYFQTFSLQNNKALEVHNNKALEVHSSKVSEVNHNNKDLMVHHSNKVVTFYMLLPVVSSLFLRRSTVVSNCGPGGQKWPQPIWKLARTGFSDLVGPDSAPSRIDPD